MAAIANLYAKYCYPRRRHNLPIVLLMHGYNGSATDITAATMERIAAYGLFVCALGLRERNGADGAKDSGARELHDIYDALTHIRSTFGSRVSQDRAAVVGYSGGGGNAIGMAAKFPDAWTDLVSYFGMSDYGAWHGENEDYRTGANNLEDTIGGTPAEVPDTYEARNHRRAAANFSGGQLWLFHDAQDGSVPISQSQEFADVMQLAGLSPYENYTGPGDAIRWSHGYPETQTDLIEAEAIWAPAIAAKTTAPWTIPASGTLQVAGYLITKRFNVWLGDGTSEAGTVEYDMATREFTITTLTGVSNWELTLKGQTPGSVSATINGVGDTQTADASGVVTFTGSIV